MAKKKLTVRINSPNKLVWEGEAKFVASENSDGKFSIFPGHANFVTALNERDIEIKSGKEKLNYKYPHAVMYAHDDEVLIYTLP